MTVRQTSVPVAIIVFNRPDTTERVFAEVAKVKPPKLLVVGDGPRISRPREAEKVAAARAIIKRVNWDCEVLTNYSDVNLGCKRRVSSGLDWVFQNVEEAIVLEDDCVPHPSFFRYCEELLEKYRDDERVAHIAGANFQSGRNGTAASYYFSRYTHIWGWASWRRAWRNYDVNLRAWPELKRDQWLKGLVGMREAKYWEKIFDRVYAGEINTWDYQWMFACWRARGFSIIPTVNLISNIGFRRDGTHTRWVSRFGDIPLAETTFPLVHPTAMSLHDAADEYTRSIMFDDSLVVKLRNVLVAAARSI